MMYFLTFINPDKKIIIGYFNSVMQCAEILGKDNQNQQYSHGWYIWAVIEQIDGLAFAKVNNSTFYTLVDGKWQNTKKPESLEHVSKFALT